MFTRKVLLVAGALALVAGSCSVEQGGLAPQITPGPRPDGGPGRVTPSTVPSPDAQQVGEEPRPTDARETPSPSVADADPPLPLAAPDAEAAPAADAAPAAAPPDAGAPPPTACPTGYATLLACFDFQAQPLMNHSPSAPPFTASQIALDAGALARGRIVIGEHPSVDTSLLTIEVSVLPRTFLDREVVLVRNEGQYELYVGPGREAGCRVFGPRHPYAEARRDGMLELNRWNRIACTYGWGPGGGSSNRPLQLWQEASAVATVPTDGPLRTGGTSGLTVDVGGDLRLDDVRIWREALDGRALCGRTGCGR